MTTVNVTGGKPKLTKAYLAILPPGPAGPSGPGGGKQIQFKFNPKTYSVKKAAKWTRTEVAGAPTSPASYQGAEPQSLDLELFMDASDTANGNLQTDVDLLMSCVVPTSESLASHPASPPYVQFGWGSTTGFIGFMKSVSVKYTMFRTDGSPYRATANLSIEEAYVPTPGQNPTSGSREARRTHVVTTGDTLQSISYREYRDATKWRAVAIANDIEDALRLQPGSRLLIPSAAEAAALA